MGDEETRYDCYILESFFEINHFGEGDWTEEGIARNLEDAEAWVSQASHSRRWRGKNYIAI
jgi:hypothetical protein